MYQYWRHKSGEVYAVQLDEDARTITGVCGPLHHSEVTPENLPQMHYSTEDVQWVDEHEQEFSAVNHAV